MTMARVVDDKVIAVGLPSVLRGRPMDDLRRQGWRIVKGTPRPADPGNGMTYVYEGPYVYNAEEDAVYGQWVQRDTATEALIHERHMMRVTRRQAKQELAAAGLLDQVQDAIDAILDLDQRNLIQIYWDDSLYLERMHPELIALGTGLGLDDYQMDDLFRAAAER